MGVVICKILVIFGVGEEAFGFHCGIHFHNFMVFLFRGLGLAFVAQHEGEEQLDEAERCVDGEDDTIGCYFSHLTWGDHGLYQPAARDGPESGAGGADESVPGEDVAADVRGGELGERGLFDGAKGTDFVPAGWTRLAIGSSGPDDLGWDPGLTLD